MAEDKSISYKLTCNMYHNVPKNKGETFMVTLSVTQKTGKEQRYLILPACFIKIRKLLSL